MRRFTLTILGLALVIGVSVCHGAWKMRVHHEGTIDEYFLSEIDSLTFYDDPTSEPGMVLIPAGTFIMGDGMAECGVSEREVTITQDFFLSRHEVTNQQYMEAVQWAYDHGHVNATIISVTDNLDGSTETLLSLDEEESEIQFDGAGTFYLRESPSPFAQAAYPGGYDPSDHPVKCVTWYGAARYCDWLSMQSGLPRAYEHGGDWLCNGGDPYNAEGYRLPTDAEWEYAAQWDDERTYPWGNDPPDCDKANLSDTGYPCVGWTTPVGSYPDAPEALGLSDMIGNLWEWVNDWFECDLETEPEEDPPGPSSGDGHVIRGGDWETDITDVSIPLRTQGPDLALRVSFHNAHRRSWGQE
jgi:formylglycine-generating enzyme required for sulfatase activity